jgi:hypothetical protein
VSKPGLNHQNTYKMTFDFIYKNKSSKKINYVECMIALEQCLAFGSLSSKNFIRKDPENELFSMPQIIIPIHVVPPEVSFVI